MARAEEVQFNIRSRFARDRAAELARATGMTTAQVVEEALRAYRPPLPEVLPPGLERRGRLLVLTGGRPLNAEETQAAIDAVRDERDDAVANPDRY